MDDNFNSRRETPVPRYDSIDCGDIYCVDINAVEPTRENRCRYLIYQWDGSVRCKRHTNKVVSSFIENPPKRLPECIRLEKTGSVNKKLEGYE